MPLILISGPLAEPVTLAEAKAHCRIDHDDEDTLIASLILAARLHIERNLDLALISQSWSLLLDSWPEARDIELPLAPLLGVQAIRIHDSTGNATTLSPADYTVDTISRYPRIVFNSGAKTPNPEQTINGIEIAITIGYGTEADDVPAPIRHALKMLVAYWYEAREPAIIEEPLDNIPAAIGSLIAPYRSARL